MSSSFHPLVSIVIPVYNGSNYLREAIDSALAQTYDNIEIIVVNDGSTDEGATEAIALSYGDKIRYFAKENGGVATALNFGIEKMQGEYFSWLSHDDLYLPEKIKKQVNALKEKKARIVYSGYHIVSQSLEFIATVLPRSAGMMHNPLLHLFRGMINGCTLLIEKSVFGEYGTFDRDRPTTQDYDLWWRTFRHVEVAYLNEPLVNTRQHDLQGSKQDCRHTKEADDLWCGMLSSITSEECRTIALTEYAFFNETALFLSESPYPNACALAKELAQKHRSSLREYKEKTLVSVVIPFFNRISDLKDCIKSALEQTHANIELVLVNDGSDVDISDIIDLVSKHENITLINQCNSGPAAARNAGVKASKGTYIAFLDSDDLFLKEKISIQLDEMLQKGKFASHTSYIRRYKNNNNQERFYSGRLTGNLMPRILAMCPIAMPTVMIHRDIATKFPFKEDVKISEDVITWFKISQEIDWLGLDFPLSYVRCDNTSAALNVEQQRIGLANQISFLVSSSEFRHYTNEIQSLINVLLSTYGYNEPTAAVVPTFKNENKYILMLKKTYLCCLQYGFRSTVKKVAEKVKNRILSKIKCFVFCLRSFRLFRG